MHGVDDGVGMYVVLYNAMVPCSDEVLNGFSSSTTTSSVCASAPTSPGHRIVAVVDIVGGIVVHHDHLGFRLGV